MPMLVSSCEKMVVVVVSGISYSKLAVYSAILTL